MKRQGGTLLSLALRVGDGLILMAALRAAYYLRFESGLIAVPKGVPPLFQYLPSFFFALILGLLLFAAHGLYAERARWGKLEELWGLFRAVSLTYLVMMAATFLYREISFSRLWLGLSWVLSLGGLAGARLGMRTLEGWLYRRGLGIRRVGIVGTGPMGMGVCRKLRERPGLGLVPVGFIRGREEEGRDAELPLPVLGGEKDIPRMAEEHELSLIVVTELPPRRRDLLHMVVDCQEAGLECQLVPDLFSLMTTGAPVTELDGIPLISVRRSPFRTSDRVLKRVLDLSLAALGLIIAAPLMAILALGIRLEGGGPVIYRQRRVGLDGRVFTMLKLRSMRPDAEAGGRAEWAREDDPRSTRLGRVLRRASLDELPQLWNVLRGEMSLVGPRPEREPFVRLFQGMVPRYLERLQVKSGVTGWAQVKGWRGNTSIEERTKHDIFYAENWSIGFDLKILLLTVGHLMSRVRPPAAPLVESLEPERVVEEEFTEELVRELGEARHHLSSGARTSAVEGERSSPDSADAREGEERRVAKTAASRRRG